jgi:hypothetical protein
MDMSKGNLYANMYPFDKMGIKMGNFVTLTWSYLSYNLYIIYGFFLRNEVYL